MIQRMDTNYWHMERQKCDNHTCGMETEVAVPCEDGKPPDGGKLFEYICQACKQSTKFYPVTGTLVRELRSDAVIAKPA